MYQWMSVALWWVNFLGLKLGGGGGGLGPRNVLGVSRVGWRTRLLCIPHCPVPVHLLSYPVTEAVAMRARPGRRHHMTTKGVMNAPAAFLGAAEVCSCGFVSECFIRLGSHGDAEVHYSCTSGEAVLRIVIFGVFVTFVVSVYN